MTPTIDLISFYNIDIEWGEDDDGRTFVRAVAYKPEYLQHVVYYEDCSKIEALDSAVLKLSECIGRS